MNKIKNKQEFEGLCLDIEGFLNLLEAYAEREMLFEVSLVLGQVKPKIGVMKDFLTDES